MSEDQEFDVFFSYNSKDREAVRRVAEKMRQQGVRVWMDEEELPYGQPWQPHVGAILEKVRSAAILLGPAGFGDWQEQEAQTCLTQGVKRHIPVIPVLLPGGPTPEALPSFLRERTCADLRDDTTGTRLQRLIAKIRPASPIPSSDSPQPSTAPRLHNLPFLPLGDLLKGRDEELHQLIANLQSSAQATAITQAIHGLGGIGKTRLAVEYAWRSGDRYDAALFVVAGSPEALKSGLASLARPGLLALPEYAKGAEAETVEAVLAWLQEHSRWLLIIDNVDTEDAVKAVREILPRLANGHVLITSRRRTWPPAVRKQPLGELTREEATQFLLQRTEGERTPAADDAEQVGRLAEILGGLPLALEQAAAYIVHHQTAFAHYLEDWEREREKVLEWHDDSVMDYPDSVATTWQTTFRQLSSKAAAILRLTAFLAPEPMPEAMFEEGKDLIEEAAEAIQEETGQTAVERTAREALAEISAYSMVTRSDGNLAVHRIVQEVLRTRIPEDRRRNWIEWSLRLVNKYAPFDADDVRTWPIWNLLRPHAARVIAEANRVGIPTPTGRLMGQLALLLLNKSLYSEAEPLMRRALQIGEETLGPRHTEVAAHLNNLASLLQNTNRLAEAEPLMRRALEIDEASFGPHHPKVAIHLNNLVTLLHGTNRLVEAEPLMRRALEIDNASLGPHHPNVAIRLNNLAQLLKATNRLAEAEPLMRRTLEIDEASFGPHHPNVARDLNNLAQLLQATNRLAEAESLMRRALEIDENSFGPRHPKVAIRLSNLAQLLQATNCLAEAEPLMRRALEIDEVSLGPYHPNVAIRLNNLARLLQATNCLAEAEPLMRRAFKIFEVSLGSGHPQTQIVRRNLETLLAEMRSGEPEA